MTPNADFPSDDPMRSDPAVGARHNGHDDVLARVVQGAHETIDRVAEQAAPHMHRLQESLSSAGELLHERADQARDAGDVWADSLRCTVRDHPLASVAAALALGVVVARLLR